MGACCLVLRDYERDYEIITGTFPGRTTVTGERGVCRKTQKSITTSHLHQDHRHSGSECLLNADEGFEP